MTTLIDLRAALVDKLGLLASDHMLSTASLNRSINNGLRRMSADYPWPWLTAYDTISLTPGTTEYALPAGLARISVVSVEDEELSAVADRGLVRSFGSKGRPTMFAQQGANLVVGPEPVRTETLNLVYTQLENQLVDDGDEPITPQQYDDVIVTYAALDQSIRLKDQALYNLLDGWRTNWIKAISDDVLSSTKVPPIQIRNYE